MTLSSLAGSRPTYAFVRTILGTISGVVVFLASSPWAGAYGSVHYFDGGINCGSSQILGVSAYVGTSTYPVLNANQIFSSEWDMVQHCADSSQYVQVGWDEDPYWMSNNGISNPNIPHYYFEWNDDDGTGFHRYASAVSPDVNSYHTYKVLDSGGFWTGTEDGTVISYVADSSITWSPDTAEYLGEISDTTAQSPGTTSDEAFFDHVYATSDGTNWFAPSLSWSDQGGVSQTCTCQSIDHSAYLSSDLFGIWDNRY